MRICTLTLPCFVAIFLSSSPAGLFALPIQFLDQSQTVDNGSNNSGGGGLASRKGQTFTPTFAGLDVVEMRFGGTTNGDSYLVNIRKTDAVGLTGTIIGTSNVVSYSVTTSTDTTAHFDFSSVVPLTPGNQYAIELVPLTLGGGSPVFTMRINTNDVYAGGAYYSSPTFLQTADGWFRTGLHESLPAIIPEPSTCTLAALGFLALLRRRRKRA